MAVTEKNECGTVTKTNCLHHWLRFFLFMIDYTTPGDEWGDGYTQNAVSSYCFKKSEMYFFALNLFFVFLEGRLLEVFYIKSQTI